MSFVTSVIFDKLICESSYGYKINVYDWKSDFLNNKIIFDKNINDTNNIEKKFNSVKDDNNNTNNHYFYLIMSDGKYKFIRRSNDILADKTNICCINNNIVEYIYNEPHESYYSHITINDNLMTIANLKQEKTTVYNIDENKSIHFNEYLPAFKKINENIIYSGVFDKITLYCLMTEQIDVIKLPEECGTIVQCEILKDKIFILFLEKNTMYWETRIAIYDINKKIFQFDYSKTGNVSFVKYNNVLAVYDNMYKDTMRKIIDSKDYKFLFLTPDIKFKQCDIIFRFE